MYRFIKGVGILLSRLTPAGLDRLARGCAVLAYDILRFRRRLILNNLTIAYGHEMSKADRVHVGRESVRHVFLTFFEFLRSVRIPLLEETTAEGVEHVTNALAQGKGAYILCGHHGNWEVMGAAGTRFAGAPNHGIVKEMRQKGADQLVDELRRKNGMYPIYRKPAGSALKAIRETLRANELVGFVLDQARPGAPRIPFFGTPAKTQTSLAVIWRKYPAPIIPVSVHRLSPGRHHITVWPALDVHATDDSQQDVLRITEQCNAMLEKMIRTCPEQYFWLHDRWKP